MKFLHRSFTLMAILAVIAGIQSPVALAQSPDPFTLVSVSDSVAIIEPERTSTRPAMDSTLSQLIDIYKTTGTAAAQVFGAARAMVVEGDLVQIVVVAEDDADMKAIRAAITGAGGVLQSAYGNLQQAMAPIGTLEKLAARADVKFIREPKRPIPIVGAQTSEGVAASLANTWHGHSVPRQGEGVKVAVIDGGFSGYATLLGTDLPPTARVTTQDYTSNWPGSSPHGTACAEIVYDMAPGVAHMYLVKIGTDVDLANAITYLIGEGVHVISMSLGWTGGGPGDGTDGGGSSPLYDALNDARTHGIFVATAAGNNRDDMWSGTYSDHPSAPNTHQWPHGSNVNCIGPGEDFSCYNIPAGYTIAASLHWNSWPSGPEDYDLYLLRWNGSAWAVVASSTNRQTTGAAPEEYISYATTSAASPYGFLVFNYSTSGPGCFRLILSHSLGASLDEQVNTRTLIFPADSPDAMSVAAVDVTSYAQEPYSSEGPRFGAGGACSGATAIKPDIAAYANVSTVSYGVGVFNGTSAATPHVAGAAVLYTGAYSATLGGGSPPTPAQIQTYLENNATDLGAVGKDTLYGAGRVTMGSLGPNALSLARLKAQSGLLFVAGLCAAVAAITGPRVTRRRKRTLD
ncbi:MAG: S8 family serine peptidase [Anaerolineae bacterium]